MVLQGFNHQASENAYPVPLLMAVLASMLEVVQEHVDKKNRPTKNSKVKQQ